MYNSRIIQLLKSFSKNEILQIDFFIKSTFLNKLHVIGIHKHSSRDKILELFNILKQEHPDFLKDKINKGNIFKKLFPDEKYNDSKVRGIINDLYKLIKLFLSIIDLFENSLHPQLHLINQLEKRNLYSILDSNINEAIDLLNMQEIRNEDLYLQEYVLSHKRWIYSLKDIYLGKSEKSFEFFENEKSSAEISLFMIILKQLSYYNHFKNHLNINIDFKFHEHIYHYLELNESIFLKNNILLIWFKVLSIHYEDIINENEVLELKILVNENRNKFSKEDYEYLNIELFNYCVRQYQRRNIGFKYILTQLFIEGLQIGSFLHDGYIHERDYTSNASLALRLGEYKLSRDFIFKYKDNLISEHRESVFNFNYGMYLYRTKDFDKALKFFSRVDRSDFYYSSEIYNAQLKIYFEIKAFETAFNKIDSYKHFLHSNELIPPEYKIMNQNFLKYYIELLKIKSDSSKYTSDFLYKVIDKTKNISYKNWLLEKAGELMKKKRRR